MVTLPDVLLCGGAVALPVGSALVVGALLDAAVVGLGAALVTLGVLALAGGTLLGRSESP